MRLASRHQAARLLFWISSSRNRRFGGGTTHMVRYVSRKSPARNFTNIINTLLTHAPCWIRTWPLSERHKARSNIEFQLVPWLPYQPRSTSCASENPFCRSCWWPKVWPGFEADLRWRVLSATADRALTCLDHQAVHAEWARYMRTAPVARRPATSSPLTIRGRVPR